MFHQDHICGHFQVEKDTMKCHFSDGTCNNIIGCVSNDWFHHFCKKKYFRDKILKHLNCAEMCAEMQWTVGCLFFIACKIQPPLPFRIYSLPQKTKKILNNSYEGESQFYSYQNITSFVVLVILSLFVFPSLELNFSRFFQRHINILERYWDWRTFAGLVDFIV